MNNECIELIVEALWKYWSHPVLWQYQNHCNIYLDEYPEQKEERKEFFAKRWNLQNEYLKRVA